jgi:hypothetical protein
LGFQPDDAGSIPVARSNSLPPRDEDIGLRTRLGQFESVREYQSSGRGVVVAPRIASPKTRVRFPSIAPVSATAGREADAHACKACERRFESGAVVHGRVVIVGAHLACTQKVGVRFPSRPPIRSAEGMRALASEAGCRWFDSTRIDHVDRRRRNRTRGRFLPGRVRVRLPPGGPVSWGCSSIGRAPDSDSGGRRFEACRPLPTCDVSSRRNWMRGTVLTCRLRVRLPPG